MERKKGNYFRVRTHEKKITRSDWKTIRTEKNRFYGSHKKGQGKVGVNSRKNDERGANQVQPDLK